MSIVYIASDTHFGHNNICRYRPEFSSREAHDEYVFNGIVETVTKRDTLWLLGDCFFTWDSVEYLKEFVKACENVNFVPGNHDTDKTERVEIFKKCVQDGYFNKVGSMFSHSGFWFTHSPIHPQELYGKMNIHGHVHRKSVPDDAYINVSVENINYRPVSLQDLKNESLRRRALRLYGAGYTHDCTEFVDAKSGNCLVCGRTRD